MDNNVQKISKRKFKTQTEKNKCDRQQTTFKKIPKLTNFFLSPDKALEENQCLSTECLKFLCSRGLALRGDSEEISDFSNGNFLGALEFLAKFDPFLAKHLES